MRYLALLLLLSLPAWAATNRTVTVKTSGGDYTTLAAAIAAEKGDMVSLDRQLTIECYAMEDTTAVSIANADWTTDSTRYILITVPTAERHEGVWSDSKYRLVVSTGSALQIGNEYVHLDGLQIRSTNTANYATSLYVGSTATTGGTVYVRNCILRGNSDSYLGGCFETYSGTFTVYFYNNLFYGADRWNGAYGFFIQTAGNYYFYNNSFAGNHTALRQSNGTIVLVNNLFTGNTNMVSGTVTLAAGTDYNRTSSAALGYTVTGAGNTHDAVSQTFSFVDAVAFNWHLAVADAGAKDLGVSDPGSGLYSTDIDGQSRSGAWSVGMDEYPSATRRRNAVVAQVAPKPWDLPVIPGPAPLCESQRLFGGPGGKPVRVIICGNDVRAVIEGSFDTEGRRP